MDVEVEIKHLAKWTHDTLRCGSLFLLTVN
jgi:hypothetical protein